MISPNYELLVERNFVPIPTVSENGQGLNQDILPRYQRIAPVIQLNDTLIPEQRTSNCNQSKIAGPLYGSAHGQATPLAIPAAAVPRKTNARSVITPSPAPSITASTYPTPDPGKQLTASQKPSTASLNPPMNASKNGQSLPVPTHPIPVPKSADQRDKRNTMNANEQSNMIPQNMTNRVTRTNDKKRQESPADSFLKEAKRVITPTAAKRHSVGSAKPLNSNNANPKRLTSTPGVSNASAQPIALSNMFSVLETQDVDNALHNTPQRISQNKVTDSVDISSPADFPPLPRRERSEPTRPRNAQFDTGHSKAPNTTNESWADIDEEDDKTIDAFLASVKGANIENVDIASSTLRPPIGKPLSATTGSDTSDRNAHLPDDNFSSNISPMNLILDALNSVPEGPHTQDRSKSQGVRPRHSETGVVANNYSHQGAPTP